MYSNEWKANFNPFFQKVLEKITIKKKIKAHITLCGTDHNGWYIGIATDPVGRLFNDHNVSKTFDSWIYVHASTADIARDVEIDLIKELKTKGDSGGGSDTTTYVYAYKITSSTRE